VPWAVLAVGVAALAVSVAAAVARHNRDADAADANVGAQRLRVDAALEKAERVPPRVEVTYVVFPLAELEQVASGDGEGPAYTVVPTEVAERLRTGRPSLHPDFGSILSTPDREVFARGFREGRIRESGTSVVALLVTPTTPGSTRLRLDVERLAPTRSFGVWDPSDLVVQETLSRPLPERRMKGTHRPERVTATIDADSAGALVPLALLHLLTFSRTAANEDLVDANHGGYGFQEATHVILSPRRLYVGRPRSKELEVAIDEALQLPLRMEPATGS
jgi:hypothetical protein